MDTDVSNLQETVNKYIQKTFYLQNQSKRNNLHFKGDFDDRNERQEDTEKKIKNALVEKLHLDPTRQDETSKPRTNVCKFASYNAKESILRKARGIKPDGISIFEDPAEKTMTTSQLPQLK